MKISFSLPLSAALPPPRQRCFPYRCALLACYTLHCHPPPNIYSKLAKLSFILSLATGSANKTQDDTQTNNIMVLGRAGLKLEAQKFGIYLMIPIVASIAYNEPTVQQWTADYFQFMKYPSNPKTNLREEFEQLQKEKEQEKIQEEKNKESRKVYMEQLKQFRQVGSRTPGHPENFCTKGECDWCMMIGGIVIIFANLISAT